MSARRCALDCLNEWENTSRFADEILHDFTGRRNLSPPDRGLTQEIFYGVLRHLFLIDRVIEQFRRGKIKHATWNLLRIGLFQLLRSEIAEHAAVNETVNLARSHEKGVVNAILRNVQRSRETLEAEIAGWPLEDRFSHPDFLIKRWTEQYGPDAVASLLEWDNRPATTFARLRRPDIGDPLASARLENFPDFAAVEGAPDPELLEAGSIYIQDPSTSLACRLLDPKPGERILDACAAPGGKTALLWDLAGGEASLVAADRSTPRLQLVGENLERLGITGVEIREADWLEEPVAAPEFDAILVDVPCSNTGVMRRRLDVRYRLQPEEFRRQAADQLGILRNCARLLKPGGRLVYSTCSIDREENEGVVEASGFAVDTTVRSLPWADGVDGSFASLLRP